MCIRDRPVPPAQAVKTDSLIRVGLFYGSSTLPTANLANEVGSGYAFGFYDSANTFISLGPVSYTHLLAQQRFAAASSV